MVKCTNPKIDIWNLIWVCFWMIMCAYYSFMFYISLLCLQHVKIICYDKYDSIQLLLLYGNIVLEHTVIHWNCISIKQACVSSICTTQTLNRSTFSLSQSFIQSSTVNPQNLLSLQTIKTSSKAHLQFENNFCISNFH